MIAENQSLIGTRALAVELGVHITTLIKWTHNDKRFKDSLFKRGYYSVQALREARILTAPAVKP